MNADEEKQGHGRPDTKQGFVYVRPRRECRHNQYSISCEGQQNVKQPVLEFGLISGWPSHSPGHDGSVGYAAESRSTTKKRRGGSTRAVGLSAMRLNTTNCKPIKAPAEDPTIT